MPTIRIDDDDDRPSRPAARKTPAPAVTTEKTSVTKNQSAARAYLIAGLLIIIGLLTFTYMFYRVSIRPKMTFHSETDLVEFRRDALSDTVPQVSVDKFFTKELVDSYQNGNGFKATFVIDNDPRDNYKATTFTCELPRWTALGNNPERRKAVVKSKAELESCVERFSTPLPTVRSIEIGLDDTDGVSKNLRGFVEDALSGVRGEIASKIHSTHLVFFRLSKADYLQRWDRVIAPGTSEEEVGQTWSQGIEWLLKDKGASKESSIATGLFNVLAQDAKVVVKGREIESRLRHIIVFSDGMENSPATTSFYTTKGIMDESNWPILQKQIQKLESCPNLQYAQITWHIPPVEGARLRKVKGFWEDTLRNVCHAKAVDITY